MTIPKGRTPMADRMAFDTLLSQLAETARSARDVVGLVAFGSTAARERADEWSDHDFAWLVSPGAAEKYRLDLTWLPHSQSIALSVVEHHGGVKVIYGNGHRLEFGIADVNSFSTWAGGPAEVIVGDDEVRRATRSVVANRPEGTIDANREIRLFLTQLFSGVGRARRGEVASGSGLVRFEAVNHLLRTHAARKHGGNASLDPLDPRRRFDSVDAAVAARIEATCQLPVEQAARALFEFADDSLRGAWDGFPTAGFAAVRVRLGW